MMRHRLTRSMVLLTVVVVFCGPAVAQDDRNVVGDSARGAAKGAIIGAIAGDAGKGAAAGAVGGALFGGIRRRRR